MPSAAVIDRCETARRSAGHENYVVCVAQQQRQQPPLPRAADRDARAIALDLERSEDSELKGCADVALPIVDCPPCAARQPCGGDVLPCPRL